MNQRKLTPEILDELPADNPEAIRSRRDLAFIDKLMGNYRWMANRMKSGGQWLELGAGSGTLATHLKDVPNIEVTAVDFAPRPDTWPPHWDWHQGDMFDFFADAEIAADGIAASLFMHHFTDSQLGKIGAMIPASVNHLLFTEPARHFGHKIQGWMGFPIFNRVTRFDMIVSIEAGFRGDELPIAIGLDKTQWKWTQSHSFWGAYRLEAFRI